MPFSPRAGTAGRRALAIATLPPIAPVLAAAVALALATQPPAAVRGQGPAADPEGWTLVATWHSRRPTGHYDALVWPTGHVPGGVGAGRHAERLAATDVTSDTVRVYAQDGLHLATWGGPGNAPGRFDDPRDVAPLPDGGWVVSDTGNDRLQILGADGTPRAEWPIASPRGVAVAVRAQGFPDEDAAIFVASGDEGRVLGFELDGTPREAPAFAVPSGVLGALELGDIGAAPDGHVVADLTVVARGSGSPVGGGGPPLGSAWHLPATGVPLLRLEWPGLGAALALRPPHVGPSAPTDDVALLVGADGLGIVPVASSGALHGPAATLPFDAVTDLGRTRGGSLVATVRPEGLVWLGDSAEGLVGALVEDASGRMFGPRFVAAGTDAMLGDALPRVALYTLDGATIADLAAPTGPLLPDRLPVADLAQDGSLRVVLRADGALHLIEDRRYTRFYEPRASSGRHIVSVAARAGRVAALDLLQQEVVLLDDRLAEIESWPLAIGGDAYVGALDIALTEDRVALARPGDGLLDVRNLVGTPFRTVVVPGGIERVAADAEGGFLVLTPGGRVVRVDAAGEVIGAFPVALPGDEPTDLAVGVYGQLYVADATGEVRVYAPDAEVPIAPVPPRPAPGTCSIGVDKRAQPRVVRLGEAVDVQLVLDGGCAEAPAQLDVALVVDRSQSMASGGRLAAAVQAALGFTARANPLAVRLALVGFDDAAALLRPLTDDRAAVADRLIGLASGGSATNLVGALRAGVAAVTGEGSRPPGEARRIVILLTDGRHTATDPPLDALDAALAEAAAANVTVYTIGLGDDPDHAALRRIAGDPSRAYISPSPRDLAAIYARIALVLSSGRLLESGLIVDVLPANMRFVAGSGTPVEPEVSPDGRTLRWRLQDVDEPGTAVAYRVVPQAAGIWPTNVEATGDLRDGFGITARVRFPVPLVEVVDPRAPSPTATSPATPSEEATPTARASASATPTPTGVASPSPSASATGTRPTGTTTPTPTGTRPRTPTATPTRAPTSALRHRAFVPLAMAPRPAR